MIEFLVSASVKGSKRYLYRLEKWQTLPRVGDNYGLMTGLSPVVEVNHHAEHVVPHITVEVHVSADAMRILESNGNWVVDDAMRALSQQQSIAA